MILIKLCLDEKMFATVHKSNKTDGSKRQPFYDGSDNIDLTCYITFEMSRIILLLRN